MPSSTLDSVHSGCSLALRLTAHRNLAQFGRGEVSLREGREMPVLTVDSGLRPPSTSLDSVQHSWTPSTPVDCGRREHAVQIGVHRLPQ